MVGSTTGECRTSASRDATPSPAADADAGPSCRDIGAVQGCLGGVHIVRLGDGTTGGRLWLPNTLVDRVWRQAGPGCSFKPWTLEWRPASGFECLKFSSVPFAVVVPRLTGLRPAHASRSLPGHVTRSCLSTAAGKEVRLRTTGAVAQGRCWWQTWSPSSRVYTQCTRTLAATGAMYAPGALPSKPHSHLAVLWFTQVSRPRRPAVEPTRSN